jgi:broad specificity phosphatase PhoE
MSAEETLWNKIQPIVSTAIEKWHDPTLSRSKGKQIIGYVSSMLTQQPVKSQSRVEKSFNTFLPNIKSQVVRLLSFYNDKPELAEWLLAQIQHVYNIGYIVKIIMPEFKKTTEGVTEIRLNDAQISDIAHVIALGWGYSKKRLEDVNPPFLNLIETELHKWNTTKTTSAIIQENLYEQGNRNYDRNYISTYIPKPPPPSNVPVPELLQTHINEILIQAAVRFSTKSLVYTPPIRSSIFLCNGLPAWLTDPAPVVSVSREPVPDEIPSEQEAKRNRSAVSSIIDDPRVNSWPKEEISYENKESLEYTIAKFFSELENAIGKPSLRAATSMFSSSASDPIAYTGSLTDPNYTSIINSCKAGVNVHKASAGIEVYFNIIQSLYSQYNIRVGENNTIEQTTPFDATILDKISNIKGLLTGDNTLVLLLHMKKYLAKTTIITSIGLPPKQSRIIEIIFVRHSVSCQNNLKATQWAIASALTLRNKDPELSEGGIELALAFRDMFQKKLEDENRTSQIKASVLARTQQTAYIVMGSKISPDNRIQIIPNISELPATSYDNQPNTPKEQLQLYNQLGIEPQNFSYQTGVINNTVVNGESFYDSDLKYMESAKKPDDKLFFTHLAQNYDSYSSNGLIIFTHGARIRQFYMSIGKTQHKEHITNCSAHLAFIKITGSEGKLVDMIPYIHPTELMLDDYGTTSTEYGGTSMIKSTKTDICKNGKDTKKTAEIAAIYESLKGRITPSAASREVYSESKTASNRPVISSSSISESKGSYLAPSSPKLVTLYLSKGFYYEYIAEEEGKYLFTKYLKNNLTNENYTLTVSISPEEFLNYTEVALADIPDDVRHHLIDEPGGGAKWLSKLLVMPEGITLKQVKDDGNCLYSAIADQVFGDPSKFAYIRLLAMISIYFADSTIIPPTELYSMCYGKNYTGVIMTPEEIKVVKKDYVVKYNKDTFWGGENERLALNIILHSPIQPWRLTDDTKSIVKAVEAFTNYGNATNKKPINILLYARGGELSYSHFDSVRIEPFTALLQPSTNPFDTLPYSNTTLEQFLAAPDPATFEAAKKYFTQYMQNTFITPKPNAPPATKGGKRRTQTTKKKTSFKTLKQRRS